jgi:hypothetical protein
MGSYDARLGGFGRAPKFPRPSEINALLAASQQARVRARRRGGRGGQWGRVVAACAALYRTITGRRLVMSIRSARPLQNLCSSSLPPPAARGASCRATRPGRAACWAPRCTACGPTAPAACTTTLGAASTDTGARGYGLGRLPGARGRPAARLLGGRGGLGRHGRKGPGAASGRGPGDGDEVPVPAGPHSSQALLSLLRPISPTHEAPRRFPMMLRRHPPPCHPRSVDDHFHVPHVSGPPPLPPGRRRPAAGRDGAGAAPSRVAQPRLLAGPYSRHHPQPLTPSLLSLPLLADSTVAGSLRRCEGSPSAPCRGLAAPLGEAGARTNPFRPRVLRAPKGDRYPAPLNPKPCTCKP